MLVGRRISIMGRRGMEFIIIRVYVVDLTVEIQE